MIGQATNKTKKMFKIFTVLGSGNCKTFLICTKYQKEKNLEQKKEHELKTNSIALQSTKMYLFICIIFYFIYLQLVRL